MQVKLNLKGNYHMTKDPQAEKKNDIVILISA